MTYETYHKRKVGQHTLHPETQMMGYGYDPHLSEGSLKPPVFLTSTFVFKNAQEGKDFFDYASGRREPPAGTTAGLVYSRFNNPNLEVLEDRLALWDGAEMAAVFSSGMAAITTTLFAYLRPGDSILISRPLYGGTEGLVDKIFPQFGIKVFGFTDGCSAEEVRKAAEAARMHGRVGLILVETPANPTNGLVDLQLMASVADELGKAQGFRPPVAMDNTFLGPVYQLPLGLGADLVLYSLTKYAGGHSDLVAGAVTGSKAWAGPVKALRGSFGNQADPNTAWMLMRSLETLSLRMERANTNAATIADYLKGHPKVASVNYLGFLESGDPRKAVYDRQCKAPGSTFSFYVKGGEAEAFRFLDRLQVIKLAVSLGGTESLCSHPASTTHSGIPKEQRELSGVNDAMIRLSIGIENPADLIADLEQALAAV